MKYQTCELSKINIDIKYLLPTSTVDPTSHPFLKNVKKNCITFIWNWCFNQVVDQSLCRVCRSIEQGSVALRNSIRWRYFLNFFLQDLRRHIQNICQEHTSPNYMIKAWTNVECTLLSLTYIWKHLQVVWYWSLLFCDQIFYKIFEWATNQKGGTGHWANMVFRFCL